LKGFDIIRGCRMDWGSEELSANDESALVVTLGVARRCDRREVPPLREPTRSHRSEREEKASARFGRNDRRRCAALRCGDGGVDSAVKAAQERRTPYRSRLCYEIVATRYVTVILAARVSGGRQWGDGRPGLGRCR
jgi:hypothetical protein